MYCLKTSYLANDDENYAPQANASVEDSGIELELVIEEENEYDSEEGNNDEPVNLPNSLTAKDGTECGCS